MDPACILQPYWTVASGKHMQKNNIPFCNRKTTCLNGGIIFSNVLLLQFIQIISSSASEICKWNLYGKEDFQGSQKS